jgi:putative ABC transport system permease protein
MFARIGNDDIPGTLSHIESVYREFDSELPYSVTFMSDIYNTLYGGQERIADIIKYSAGLALIISCLGLFGLATFTTEQRTKEIGIRKVLGASVSGIIGMLSKQVVLQIVIANIVGGSAAFVFMSGYLREFAYRTPIGWQPFAVSVLVTMGVAMLSVSIQAVKAALANPVDTLRHE